MSLVAEFATLRAPHWRSLFVTAPESLDTRAGAAVYSRFVLRLYDAWVLGVSNRYAWKCPTSRVLLPFYRKHLGRRHLDVGVGTGWYLAHAGLTSESRIALLDLNENSLHAAAARSGRPDAVQFARDVMQPLDLDDAPPFDSIALFYLLHCLPGGMADKARVFAHLAPHLAPDGVLYGATILGDEAGHNCLGRMLMRVYNRKGVFGNRGDTATGLEASLRAHFRQVEVRRHGKVALFTASGAVAR